MTTELKTSPAPATRAVDHRWHVLLFDGKLAVASIPLQPTAESQATETQPRKVWLSGGGPVERTGRITYGEVYCADKLQSDAPVVMGDGPVPLGFIVLDRIDVTPIDDIRLSVFLRYDRGVS